MADNSISHELDARRLAVQERRLDSEVEARHAELDGKRAEQAAQQRQAAFDRRYRLLELRERREDRKLRSHELELTQGRGIKFTSAQATVAAAVLAVLSAVIGGWLQSTSTRAIEENKTRALISIEEVKAHANIDLEKQKQEAAERLDRAKFETTLILKAVEAPKREDQIRNLKFFLTAGFIRDPDSKIANMDERSFPSLPPPVSERQISPTDLYQQFGGSVGLMRVAYNDELGRTEENQGTCTVISKNGYALTTYHLFQIKPINLKITVSFGSNRSEFGTLVRTDQEIDLALIKLSDNTDYIPVKISREQIQPGSEVITIGYQAGAGNSVSSGRVVSTNGPRGTMTISTLAGYGSSGSPVFSSHGEVIGILQSRVSPPGEISTVLPIQFARPILAMVGLD
jgi:S1-C subfamily serine protease